MSNLWQTPLPLIKHDKDNEQPKGLSTHMNAYHWATTEVFRIKVGEDHHIYHYLVTWVITSSEAELEVPERYYLEGKNWRRLAKYLIKLRINNCYKICNK